MKSNNINLIVIITISIAFNGIDCKGGRNGSGIQWSRIFRRKSSSHLDYPTTSSHQSHTDSVGSHHSSNSGHIQSGGYSGYSTPSFRSYTPSNYRDETPRTSHVWHSLYKSDNRPLKSNSGSPREIESPFYHRDRTSFANSWNPLPYQIDKRPSSSIPESSRNIGLPSYYRDEASLANRWFPLYYKTDDHSSFNMPTNDNDKISDPESSRRKDLNNISTLVHDITALLHSNNKQTKESNEYDKFDSKTLPPSFESSKGNDDPIPLILNNHTLIGGITIITANDNKDIQNTLLETNTEKAQEELNSFAPPPPFVNCRSVMNSVLNENGEIIDSVKNVCDPLPIKIIKKDITTSTTTSTTEKPPETTAETTTKWYHRRVSTTTTNPLPKGYNCRRVMNSELSESGEIIDSVTEVCDPPTTTTTTAWPLLRTYASRLVRTTSTTTTEKPYVRVCKRVMNSFLDDNGEIVDTVNNVCTLEPAK